MTPVPLFRVESPGLLTTVQDLGRWGHQQDGMTVVGAMDSFAASIANLLVGNPRGDAVLEITLMGPKLSVLSDTRMALCGGDLSPALDGEPLALWKTQTLRAGQTLAFGRRRIGARAYLAVAGGFSVPLILGSRATFLRGNLGGFAGRRLQTGDVLEGRAQSLTPGERGLRPPEMPTYPLPALLRVVLGPHFEAFSDESRTVFFSSTYTLSPQSDRQGYRLSGPTIARADLADILSEAMPLGGIQIPPDGQPILLMADRQTTGGYPLIGTVISADLPRAGQLAPGDPVRFQSVELAEARELALRQERWLRIVGQG
jgi:antagonist of KipI